MFINKLLSENRLQRNHFLFKLANILRKKRTFLHTTPMFVHTFLLFFAPKRLFCHKIIAHLTTLRKTPDGLKNLRDECADTLPWQCKSWQTDAQPFAVNRAFSILYIRCNTFFITRQTPSLLTVSQPSFCKR